MAMQTVQLGGDVKSNIKKINDNFANVLTKDNEAPYTPSGAYNPATKSYVDTNMANVLTKDNTTEFTPTTNYQPATKKYVDDAMSGAGLGDMLKSVYDQDDNGIVDNAEKVNNALTVAFNGGTVEGTSKYTFDGSSAKSVNIIAGTNVSITETSGSVTIASADTDTVTQLRKTNVANDVTISDSLASGNIVLGDASAKVVSTTSDSDNGSLPTLGIVKGYVDDRISGAKPYKGAIAGTTPAPGAFTPAAESGDLYRVSAEGFVNGVKVEVGDVFMCKADTEAATSSNYETIQANWGILQGNLDGAVISSVTSVVDGQVPVFDRTSGRIIKSSGHVLEKDVTADAELTDTKAVKVEFDNATNWSTEATDGVYTLTLTVDSGRYPMVVFNGNGRQVQVGINLINATTVTIESYDKFAGYVILI